MCVALGISRTSPWSRRWQTGGGVGGSGVGHAGASSLNEEDKKNLQKGPLVFGYFLDILKQH
jgi:hypothetical protein